jgi:hypothetical protein
MNGAKLIVAVGFVAAVALAPSPALAQGHRGGGAVVGHAAPRTGGSHAIVRPYVPSYRPYFRPGFSLGFYYGYPGYYAPYYAYGYPYGYGYPAYGYPYGYGYVGAGTPSGAYGGVRIDLPQRDAEVYADGYYAGIVDDFDGALQHLDLPVGPHHIEVRANGFEPIAFDVAVQPGRTIAYRAALQPIRP